MSARKALFSIVLTVWVASLVGCDHATKSIAQQHLRRGEPRQLISGVLDLRYVENRDVAFRTLRWIPQQLRRRLVLCTQALVVTVLIVLLVGLRDLNAPERLALALILAGGLGNFIGRAAHGFVVDFIHLSYWPVFNLADAYITVGAVFLLLSKREMLLGQSRTKT